jgi:hypothetical protein
MRFRLVGAIGRSFILAAILSSTEYARPVIPWDNMPPKIREAFASRPIDGVYDLSDRINPLYLRGDFDGDGIADYAVLITQVGTGKKGIAVWLSSKQQIVILGAGLPIQSLTDHADDLTFDHWRVTGKNMFDKSRSIEQPTGIRSDAIFVEWSESASGIFYWKLGRFQWLQQGD